ncbi:MAG TPA: ankyrin repeat domain-containing protein [Blastocatellia bacterium]|nr:ankyrin repeat domain-containing protein [Blastocatellia bacterium]
MLRLLLIISLTISAFITINCAGNPEKNGAGAGGSSQSGDPSSRAGASRPSPGPQIMEAAASGDAATVTSLLAGGTDVNTRSEFGVTPLMAASAKGHIEIVKALLAQGADVSIKDKQGLTARVYAENSGHKEIVEVLASAGASE